MQTSPEMWTLPDVPLDEALDRWLSELEYRGAARPLENEAVPVEQCLHRITAEPVVAKLSSPHYYAAAIDGLAVRAHETFSASGDSPVRIGLEQGARFVDTGSPMPEECDAVLPFHELELVGQDAVEVRRSSNPWRNVRPIGEDIAAREVVLPRDHRIGPLDLGALVAAGLSEVKVYRRPRVAVLPVGNHLVAAGEAPKMGEMIDSNSPILGGLVQTADAVPTRLGVVKESLAEAGAALAEACENFDLVLMVAGPSHGTGFLARLFSELGDCVLHGVAIRPGHSLALGLLDGTPVVGLPFHPAPAYLAFTLFGRPVLARLNGREPSSEPWPKVKAFLAQESSAPNGVEQFVRVKLGVVDDRRIAVADAPGAPTLMSLVRADGLVRVPADSPALAVGTEVEVLRLAPERSLAGNVLLLGTHDICYDILRNLLQQSFPDVRLHTAATGGTAGLRCLKEGSCHIAALHLFDEISGQYNVPQVASQMADTPVILLHLFKRYLGLVVKEGNPLGLRGLPDLSKVGLRFINRQPGSGTRALLDYHLSQAGVDTGAIEGFDQEVRTHMAVAAAVAAGVADTGPSISTAAKALRLDFIPCISESLDLAIPKRFLAHYPVRALIQVIRGARFRSQAERHLADYDFSETGKLVWESP